MLKEWVNIESGWWAAGALVIWDQVQWHKKDSMVRTAVPNWEFEEEIWGMNYENWMSQTPGMPHFFIVRPIDDTKKFLLGTKNCFQNWDVATSC